MKKDVFISYSRKDYVVDGKPGAPVIPDNIIDPLLAFLDKNGISYWIDLEGIYSSDQFIGKIRKAIDSSHFVIFISSIHSHSSEWTAMELGYAKQRKHRIFPIELGTAPQESDTRFLLSIYDFIDYPNLGQEKTFDKLLKSLNYYLDEADPNRRTIRELKAQLTSLTDEIKRKEKELQNVVADLAKLGVEVKGVDKKDNRELAEQYKHDLASREKEIDSLKNSVATLTKKLQDANLESKNLCVEVNKYFQQANNEREKRKQQEIEFARHRFESSSAQNENRRYWLYRLSPFAAAIMFVVCVGLLLVLLNDRAFMQPSGAEEDSLVVLSPDPVALIDTVYYDESTQAIRYNEYSYSLVRVKGGTFTMGADSDHPHQVTLSTYHIGKTEVPQWLWQAVMGENPSCWKGDMLPVESVNGADCQAFIEKLNLLTLESFAMPTESQWEFAARGGNKSQGYKYCGSNTLGDVAWYKYNSDDRTHEVGTKLPNELGIYDMNGNVGEWCEEVEFKFNEDYRACPGGSFDFDASWCQNSAGTYSTSDSRDKSHGLRLVLLP